ncbi:MAG: hypothetical protein ABI408_13820 [Gemmatimonadaceae bacterium]
MRLIAASRAVACAAILSLAACGSDSTGPANLDSTSALQSLRLGLGPISGIEGPSGATVLAGLNVIAPLLDQINVNIDGKSQTMFAMGLRESFPPGTCEEDVFIDPNFPPPPGACTPMSLGVVLLLWQSHAANAIPDRMIVIGADDGTTNFDFSTASSPGIALYIQGTDFRLSLNGTLTTHTASTGQSCNVPLPPYAKSATCNVATLGEDGMILFDSDPTVQGSVPHTLTISQQSLHGLWLAITGTQPVTLTQPAPIRGLLRLRGRA